MIDVTSCDPEIKNIICSICERILVLNRRQILQLADDMPDEAINIEIDKLESVLKMYSQLCMVDLDSIKPGRWAQWIYSPSDV